MQKSGVPSYRRHRDATRGDRAFVELDGRRHYLGRFDSPESRQRYAQLIAEGLASGVAALPAKAEITIMELSAAFLTFAESYYRKPDGTASSELGNVRQALRPLKELYGAKLAKDFGPRAFRAVRDHLILKGITRKSLNRTMGRVKLLFRWAVSEELLEEPVYRALLTVPGLKRGRSEARETEPVRPVADAQVEAVRPHVSEEIWAMVQLQLATGCRSGEVVLLRPCDLDMSGAVWTYKPQSHKGSHREHERTIYLGPQAQAVLRPFLQGCGTLEHVFSPRRAEERRRARVAAERKTPLSCGNAPGTNRVKNPKRVPGERYKPTAYARAIARACELAKVDHWHPHQLRHAAATRVRREFGIEVARILLGHRTLDVTEVYAAADKEKAVAAAERMG